MCVCVCGGWGWGGLFWPTNYCMRGKSESMFLCPADAGLNFLIGKMMNSSHSKMAIILINDIAAMIIDHIFHLKHVCVVICIIQNLEV